MNAFNLKKILKAAGVSTNNKKDLHILRFYSSFVVVSCGKVIGMTNPSMKYCPLVDFLYKGIKSREITGVAKIKEFIKIAVNGKISKFGHFTEKRELYRDDIAVPYGASEMLMYAMNRGIIDSAVLVCDGAGTVITDKPGVVQGIGARMNGLFYTSPIAETIKRLKAYGCNVISPDAKIQQLEGVIKAAEIGYKNIAVTLNGFTESDLSRLRKIERDYNASVTSLIVCTSGISRERVKEINKYADLVWSCASQEIREETGKKAVLQLSLAIPVFVLTKKGLKFVSGYSSDEKLIRDLDTRKQYLICNKYGGKKIKMGNFNSFLTGTNLPVRSNKEPII